MAPPEKEIVLDVTDSKDAEQAVERARAIGIRKVLTRAEFPSGLNLDGLQKYSASEKGAFAWVEIRGSKDMQKAMDESARTHDFVVVDCTNWKIIPLENLIAEYRRKNRKLYAFMKERDDIKLAFSILEKGVDGIVIPPGSLEVAREIIGSEGRGRLRMVRAKVKKVVDVGDGERVCIDTASQLMVGEGMLVGSRASFFFLVHSETIPSEYIPTRPFRVNAGALHSYVLGVDGKTRYLSELQAGDRVRLVNSSGEAREAAVGRIKMERRPLVMITAEAEGQEGTAMLQKAETIRLVRPDGTPIAVTDLKEGDEVLAHLAANKARHFGGEVDEFIVER